MGLTERGVFFALARVMQKTNWNKKISIGSALEEGDAQKLHDEGIRTIIDLRTSEEINPAEKTWVEGVGLDYEVLPTAPNLLDDVAVMRFIQEVDSSNGPVYVHCKMGGRAGIMALLHDAVAGGWTIEKTMQIAKEKEVKLGDDSPYVDFVQDYLERHSAGERLKRG